MGGHDVVQRVFGCEAPLRDERTVAFRIEHRVQRGDEVLRGEIGGSDHGKIYALAISPSGKLLAAGGATGRTGGTSHPIRLYDFASGEIVRGCAGRL